jgi:GNAT superfamily N-acetyltransferase
LKDMYFSITPNSRADYRDLISHVSEEVWPEFMLHDPIANENWDALFETFPDYQFALIDQASERVAGIGNSVPFHWEAEPEALPDDGWDWALIRSVTDQRQGRTPNLLCGLQISITPHFQGRRLSEVLLGEMIALARSKGFPSIVIPVRPNKKDQYPLTPIDRYIEWKNPDGLPFDPWLRVHVRNGGRILKPCPSAMRVIGTVAEWEEWTGLRFFESGEYIVPGALVPMTIDKDEDRGEYVEPNVWVIHSVIDV